MFLIFRLGPRVEINHHRESISKVNKIFKTIKQNQVSIDLKNRKLLPKFKIRVPKSSKNTNDLQILLTNTSINSTNNTVKYQISTRSISTKSYKKYKEHSFATQIKNASALKNNQKEEIYIYASHLYAELFSEPKLHEGISSNLKLRQSLSIDC